MFGHFGITVEGVCITYVNKDFPEFGGCCRFTNGEIPIFLSGKLKRLDLDLQQTFLMRQVKEPRVEHKIPAFYVLDESFIELGFLLFDEFGRFCYHAGENCHDMFAALEVRVIL